MVHSPSYVFAEKFFPIINVLVWTAFSWVYFKSRRSAPVLSREALTLGAFWLFFAILVDYVGFVLIKNPISLSAHDFYIGQFPWIYLIYLAILVSPILYATLRSKRANRHFVHKPQQEFIAGPLKQDRPMVGEKSPLHSLRAGLPRAGQ